MPGKLHLPELGYRSMRWTLAYMQYRRLPMAISTQAAMVHGWLICKGAVDRHVLYLRRNIKYHEWTLKRYNN